MNAPLPGPGPDDCRIPAAALGWLLVQIFVSWLAIRRRCDFVGLGRAFRGRRVSYRFRSRVGVENRRNALAVRVAVPATRKK